MVAGRFTTLPVDGYVGVAVAAFILWSGIGIAKDTVAPLLGEAADPEVARNIRRIVMESDHIVGVHDMIIHNYGAVSYTHLDVYKRQQQDSLKSREHGNRQVSPPVFG